MSASEQYGALSAPFDQTYKLDVGGTSLTYITMEQVVTRLNEVIGFGHWSFTVKDQFLNAEADEVVVLGHLTVEDEDSNVVTLEQFGGKKVVRSRSSGSPLDLGNDYKAASSDALKKCASLIGVGLYLSSREYHAGSQQAEQSTDESEGANCADCGAALAQTRFRDGTVWSVSQLAGYGRRKHNRILCMEHYRAANENRRRAERELENSPF